MTRPTPWIAAAGCVVLAFAALGAAPPNLSSALESQRRLLAERPDDAAAHNDLGNLLALAGDSAGAEAAYRRALELAPDRAAPRYNLALLLQQRGDRREALKQYRGVIDLDPSHAWAHYQIGSLYEADGDEKKAVRAYAKAFSLEPRLAFAEFNPAIIENRLVAEAMLRGYRGSASEPQAPKVYEDPGRIAGLLLPPIPVAVPEDGEGKADDEKEQAPPDEPAPGRTGPAAAVLSGDDLDQRGGVNQASPQGAPNFRPPAAGRPTPRAQVRTWSEAQGGSEGRTAPSPGIGPSFIPVQPGTTATPPGATPPRVVEPPGRVRYQPGVESTGRLDLEIIPGPAPYREG